MLKRVLQLAVLTAVLTSRAEESPPPYSSVVVPGVPHVVEKPDFCGEASAEMFLRKLGENMDQDYVFDRGDVDPALGRGLDAEELARALGRIGFDVGETWRPAASRSELDAAFAALHQDLTAGVPSIVLLRDAGDGEHFVLALGYDGRADEVLYSDPARADGAYLRMPRGELLERWSLQGAYQWGVVRIRLDAGELEYGDAADGPTAADFAQHVMELRRTVPPGFTIAVEPPFAVISDAAPAEIDRYAHRTIRRAVALLKKDFFARDPEEIVDIWLFSDDASYTEHTRRIFGESPDTPYGYYSSELRAIVINISTGGGTLVHEIVHPFMAANFPEAPAWLDEGLASLFEYPTAVDGHLRGLVNWRLPTLKAAIALGALPTFEWLTSRSDEQFYAEDPGTNYAEARFLCYYLQQRGALVRYYHAFYEARAQDPTGYRTLLATLGAERPQELEAEWAAWVLGLRQAR